MKKINIIFPHQLLINSPLLSNGYEVYLIEEYNFFQRYQFHKQKLAFHRASMCNYKKHLECHGIKVHYIDTLDPLSEIGAFIESLNRWEIDEVHIIDPINICLRDRIKRKATSLKIITYENPIFINTRQDLSEYFHPDKKFYSQATFYRKQRKKLNVLLDTEGKPVGGKWSYDVKNRKKYPKNKVPPSIKFVNISPAWRESTDYINNNFQNNPGTLSNNLIYPLNHQESQDWLHQFLKFRFYDFGSYEDSIVMDENILNHSLLSPLLNVGLLTPRYVLDQSLEFANNKGIPINSSEGFIRQIIGWREFIRGIYQFKSNFFQQRNFWGFERKIPSSFYDGSTGILPLDQTIKKVIDTGYCHHIERLMILGNFMLLCEFDPNEVYVWFMEMFVDSCDWVMVPNVYGMSQFADGGTFATKPYIGGSNYIRKMSDYPTGKWEQVWDGLFWRFIHKRQDFFKGNPRTSMMYHIYNRMPNEKRLIHIRNAEKFIEKIT